MFGRKPGRCAPCRGRPTAGDRPECFSPTEAACGTINGEAFMEGRTTAPVLPNLPAYIECQVERIVDTDGDHAVVILRVVEAECRDQVRPLTIAESPWEYGG